MIQELLYTSAPKGLKPGSRGFCTVLSTSGMPAPVATALESLSGYRPVFPPGDPQAPLNPVVYSHLQMSLNGRRSSVLSRIADYGLDYSQRTNKLAHHLVIDSSERPSAGPAWVLAHSGMTRHNWDGELKLVSGEQPVPQGDSALRVCSEWKDLTGDAGWAGVLAEAFLKHPEQPAFLIFSPGMDLLPLLEEAIALLPAQRRWDVTFSTYFTKIPNGVTCNWRCLLADSPEAKESRRFVQSLRIDLTQPLQRAKGGALVEAARTGRMVESSEMGSAPPYPGLIPPPLSSGHHSAPPIRVSQDPSPPPLIPGHTPVLPGRKRKTKASGKIQWIVILLLIAATAAGSGFYLSELKQRSKTTSTVTKNEVTEKPTDRPAPSGTEKQVEAEKSNGTAKADADKNAEAAAGENADKSQMPDSVAVANQQGQPPEMDAQKVSDAGKSQMKSDPAAAASSKNSKGQPPTDPAKDASAATDAAMAAAAPPEKGSKDMSKESVVEMKSDPEGQPEEKLDGNAGDELPKYTYAKFVGTSDGKSAVEIPLYVKNPSDYEVEFWTATCDSGDVRAEGNRVVIKDDVPFFSLKFSDTASEGRFQLLLKEEMESRATLSRHVAIVRKKGTNEESFVLFYEQPVSDKRSGSNQVASILTDVAFPDGNFLNSENPRTWKLNLDRLVAKCGTHQIKIHSQSDQGSMKWNSTGQAEMDIAIPMSQLDGLAGNKFSNLMTLIDRDKIIAGLKIKISSSNRKSNGVSSGQITAVMSTNPADVVFKTLVESDVQKIFVNTVPSEEKLDYSFLESVNIGKGFHEKLGRLLSGVGKVKSRLDNQKKQLPTNSDSQIHSNLNLSIGRCENQISAIKNIQKRMIVLDGLLEELRKAELSEITVAHVAENSGEQKSVPILVYKSRNDQPAPKKK